MDEKKVHDFGGDKRKRGYVREKERWGEEKRGMERERTRWDGGRKEEERRGERKEEMRWDGGKAGGGDQTRWDGGENRTRWDGGRKEDGGENRTRWDGGKTGGGDQTRWDGGRKEDGGENRTRWDGGRKEDGRGREEKRWDGGKSDGQRTRWDGGSKDVRREDRTIRNGGSKNNFRNGERQMQKDWKGNNERRDRDFGRGRDFGRDRKGKEFDRRDGDRYNRDRQPYRQTEKRFGNLSQDGVEETKQQKSAIEEEDQEEEREEEKEEGKGKEEEVEETEEGDEVGEEEKEMLRGQQEMEMKGKTKRKEEREEKGEGVAVRDPLGGKGEEIGEEELELIKANKTEYHGEPDPDTTPEYTQTGQVDKGSWEHLEMLSRCPGCGCLLQSEDPRKIGYTPASVVETRMAQMSDKNKPKAPPPNSYREGDEKYAEGDVENTETVQKEDKKATGVTEEEGEKGEEKEEKEWDEGEIESEDAETKRLLENEEIMRAALPEEESGSWGEEYMETFYESPEQEERLLQRDLEKQKKYNVEPEYMAYLESLMGKKKKNRPLICQRCYLLKNYNRVVPIRVPVEEFRERLSRLAEINCVVIKVVDLFDFSGTFVSDFRKVIGNNPVILIGNKRDLLPKDIHQTRIIDWMRHEAKLRGLQVSRVHLMSSLKGEGMKEFMEDLKVLRRNRDVYVVGCSNVGKSTFINKLIKTVGNRVANLELLPTTSPFPGTTLNLISVPIWDDAALYDTPGIYNDSQMVKLLQPDELKLVYPKTMIKPAKRFIEPGRSIFLGGLVRIDYIEGPPAVFSFYVASYLPVHLTKIERADTIYEKHLGEMLTPPIGKERAETFKQMMMSKEYVIPTGLDIRHAHHDLVISGLGWIAMHGKQSEKMKNCVVKVYFPKGVGISIRDPLVPMTKFEKSKGAKRRAREKKKPILVK